MRKPRILQEGAKYHVSARTNHKDMLLEAPFVKNLFLDTIKRAKKKYDFRIENFVVMGNHFHFIIEPLNGVSLSLIMKWILGVFAMCYNSIFKVWGHFWGDRYFSRIISSGREYLKIFNYIDQNPVKALLVKVPEEWKWCGRYHLLLRRFDIIEP